MLVLVAWVLLLVGSTRAEAVPNVSFDCTPAPDDCSGWFRSNVSVTWSVLPTNATRIGCANTTLISDTRGVMQYCRATDANGVSVTVEFPIKVDKTAPAITSVQPARAADVNGWYNRAVGVSFIGGDATSGIEFCTSPTYGGPDSASASVTGRCQDVAGNVTDLRYGFKFDQTAPVLSGASPERPPNAGGWFNRPVRFDLLGADATSGIADCPSVTYGGPDSADASFMGGCRDQAGNSASSRFSLKYDATPPTVTDVKAAGGDRSVTLNWRASADSESVEVVRTPGVGVESATPVFRGQAAGFIDGRVQNGVRYSYEVRANDAAGNIASASTVGVPVAGTSPDSPPPGATGTTPQRGVPQRTARLIGPKLGTLVRRGHPPLLRWTPVRRARYYNLQISRGGRKILSVWPTRPRYQLKRQWSFGGRRWQLEPGTYRWYVWPGFGARSKVDYGRRMGPGMFRVVRR